MEVQKFTWDVVDSNSWLIIEGTNGLLIDAVENERLYSTVCQLDSLTIILTHSHFDHIVGLNKIRNIIPNTTVISTQKCSENMGNKYRNMSSSATAFLAFYMNGEKRERSVMPFVCEVSDYNITTKMTYEWNGHTAALIPVFGHSNDGLVVYLDNKLLFTGDTLLTNPTITRFPGGSKERLLNEDFPLLNNLNVERVFPGHGNAGCMDQMITINQRIMR